MKTQLLFFSFTLCLGGVVFAEPILEKTNIFTAHEGGYDVYRIPAIAVTPKGTILTFCEARMLPEQRAGADWAKIDILMRRSTDGGKTWSAARNIITPPENPEINSIAIDHGYDGAEELTVNNAVPIVDNETGTIHLIYCIEYARCYYMRSEDDGETFSESVDITEVFEKFKPEYPWKVIATGPGHGIKLSNGCLFIPVWMSIGTGGGAHRPSAVSTIFSNDEGKTWERGEIVVNHPELVNPSETIAVELADGRIMLNIRHETFDRKNKSRYRAITTSPNGADQWTPITQDDELPESICMANILRLSKESDGGKNRILFVNPHNPDGRERKNVTLKLSYDETENWSVVKALEPGRSGYSDLAMGTDGFIYCFYERGTFDKHHHNTANLCVAKFNLEWLTDGTDSF